MEFEFGYIWKDEKGNYRVVRKLCSEFEAAIWLEIPIGHISKMIGSPWIIKAGK